ncbi:MAG: hypothetical protein F6J93_06275 [Oscillatoria sp. SIO1A7]|nr:hypothetical protein [Oscillatoria sp. SIO1A7]
MRQTRRAIAQNLKNKRSLCLLLEKGTERSLFLKIGNRDLGYIYHRGFSFQAPTKKSASP